MDYRISHVQQKCALTEKCPIEVCKKFLSRAGGRLHIFVDTHFCCIFLLTNLCNKKVPWLSSKIFRAGKSFDPAHFCYGWGLIYLYIYPPEGWCESSSLGVHLILFPFIGVGNGSGGFQFYGG